MTTKVNVGIEDYDDISPDFHKEIHYIAKVLQVSVGSVQVTDHPCGEYCIFVKKGGERVWYGYVDFWFYKAMDQGLSWQNLEELGYEY